MKGRIPWHVWVVGVLALLWYVSGAYTIVMAQTGKLPNLSAGEIAYYAAQPLWFMLVTDVALLAALAGSIALLVRRRAAVWLFSISLGAILLTHIYDLAVGTSRAFANNGAMIVTGIIIMIAIAMVLYCRAMRRQGILA